MHRRGGGVPPAIDLLWQAWLTECCDPYAWRKTHATLARFAVTPPTLDELLSWQDSGIVPPSDQTWALGEALYESGVAGASGFTALWIAGHLHDVVCVMATRGGRWPEILHGLALAVSRRTAHDAANDRRSLIPSPFRELVTLTSQEHSLLRDLWREWGGRARLPTPTSGYYRGLDEMVADDAAALVERRRRLDVVVAAELPSNWPRTLDELAHDNVRVTAAR
ncbi:hypothetical protein EPN44_00915 [bacterium]|nr:MAG: hypothetical protein EPN44_00915 [bacterium]